MAIGSNPLSCRGARRADALQHAHPLELAVDPVDMARELGRVAEHDGSRTRQVELDVRLAVSWRRVSRRHTELMGSLAH
jgi:hypothetical protein